MHILKAFFKSKWLEIAIIAIGLQLITNAVSIFLGNNPVTIMLTAFMLILFIVIFVFAHDFFKKRNQSITEGDALSTSRKGIIFTIGLKSHGANSPVMKVIKKLRPKYCAFIGTEKTFEANIAKTIANDVDLRSEFYKEKIIDPTDIKEIKETTINLIQWMIDEGLLESDIVVDITGGTAIMSVASYMGAAESKIDTQYIYSEYRDNKPVEGSQKALMVKQL